MRKLLAVTALDLRRLGAPLISVGLAAGLVPALASGLGTPVPARNILAGCLGIVALACGLCFGNDFAPGKASFLLARPLSVKALFGGRLTALLLIAATTAAAFWASGWISTRGESQADPRLGLGQALQLILNSWVLALFAGLVIATRANEPEAWKKPSEIARRLLRMTLLLSGFAFSFGLLADLVFRAYPGSGRGVTAFLESWVVAAFVACFVAVSLGRADRTRIAAAQHKVIMLTLLLSCAGMAAWWQYVLHPGPEAIREVRQVRASPDGKKVYVRAKVNRGDPKNYAPTFVLDLESGVVRHLPTDPLADAPWTSNDGRFMAWTEATPLFFRPFLQLAFGAHQFRITDEAGVTTRPLMPATLASKPLVMAGLSFGGVRSVLPFTDGDTLVTMWDDYVAFTSRTRGDLSNVDLEASGKRAPLAAIQLASGDLRLGVWKSGAFGTVEFIDIHPADGRITPLPGVAAGTSVHFDGSGGRALVVARRGTGRGSLSLVSFDSPHPSRLTIVDDELAFSEAFLSDGRIGVSVGPRGHAALRVYSARGELILNVPIVEAESVYLAGEVFPGVLGVTVAEAGGASLLLVDALNGALIRRLQGYRSTLWFASTRPPAGSLGARLLMKDGRLYVLPSIDGEPRLLLPAPTQ